MSGGGLYLICTVHPPPFPLLLMICSTIILAREFDFLKNVYGTRPKCLLFLRDCGVKLSHGLNLTLTPRLLTFRWSSFRKDADRYVPFCVAPCFMFGSCCLIFALYSAAESCNRFCRLRCVPASKYP